MQNSQKSSHSDDEHVELNEIKVEVEEVKGSDVIKPADEKSNEQLDKGSDDGVDMSKQTRPQGFFLS